ncbi:MAG TPA: hypothetical protein VME41_00040 [Stellaceae bacterium]|nr:hypothetical protein [Stellaceae bacterium]
MPALAAGARQSGRAGSRSAGTKPKCPSSPVQQRAVALHFALDMAAEQFDDPLVLANFVVERPLIVSVADGGPLPAEACDLPDCRINARAFVSEAMHCRTPNQSNLYK